MQNEQCRKRSAKIKVADDMPPPEKFADALTADHCFVADGEQARHGEKTTLAILDRHTHWLQGHASKTKNAEDTGQGFDRFLGPRI